MVKQGHDLGTKDGEQVKPVKETDLNKAILSTVEIPELADFNIGDKVEIKFKAVVKEISHPEAKDNVVKADEPAEYTLDFVEGEVLNISDARKEAQEMGVSMDSYKKTMGKRRGGDEAPVSKISK